MARKSHDKSLKGTTLGELRAKGHMCTSRHGHMRCTLPRFHTGRHDDLGLGSWDRRKKAKKKR